MDSLLLSHNQNCLINNGFMVKLNTLIHRALKTFLMKQGCGFVFLFFGFEALSGSLVRQCRSQMKDLV